MSVIAGGSRIALERQVGWTRQLRITPLSTVNYLRAKLASSYMMALISLVLIAVAGIAVWSAVMARAAVFAYRRSSTRA